MDNTETSQIISELTRIGSEATSSISITDPNTLHIASELIRLGAITPVIDPKIFTTVACFAVLTTVIMSCPFRFNV